MRQKSGNSAFTHDKGAYLKWVRRNHYYVCWALTRKQCLLVTIYDYLLIIKESRWRSTVAALGVTIGLPPRSFISCTIFRESKNE
jgi:hypothetical protein